MGRPVLQLENVSKKFNDGDERGTVVALEGLDLTICAGEFVTIIGPSGCGKTTLLRIMAGLTSPSEGHCYYKGNEIVGPSLERGYVFQDPRLFPWLTVLDNVRLAGEKGERFLAKMHLSEFKDAFPHELSGGMAKRAALARALAAEPDLLLLDEPLTNLDLSTRTGLQKELHNIWQQGVTCILVTHDIDEALILGTRLILLSQRPARIMHDISLNEPFPRNPKSEEYQGWKQRIIDLTMGVAY